MFMIRSTPLVHAFGIRSYSSGHTFTRNVIFGFAGSGLKRVGSPTLSLFRNRGQAARFSSRESGGSGWDKGQQEDWVRKMMATKDELDSDPSAFETACYHPDRQRDIRAEALHSKPLKELLAITDRFSHRLQYLKREPWPATLHQVQIAIQDIRSLSLEQINTNISLTAKQLNKLLRAIERIAISYHNGELDWYFTGKMQTLWKMFDLLLLVKEITLANRILHILRVGEKIKFKDTTARSRVNSIDPNDVHVLAGRIICSLDHEQFLEQKWFKPKDETLLLQIAGQLRRFAESGNIQLQHRGYQPRNLRNKDLVLEEREKRKSKQPVIRNGAMERPKGLLKSIFHHCQLLTKS